MQKYISNAWSEFYTSGLFFDELMHGIVSVPFALITYIISGNSFYALVSFMITYLVDSDHLFDYFLYYGLVFSPVKFLKMDYFHKTKRAFVFFHAWEWVIMLLLLTLFFEQQVNILTAIAIGLAGHLVWDSITVKSVWFYFISYRISSMFVIKK